MPIGRNPHKAAVEHSIGLYEEAMARKFGWHQPQECIYIRDHLKRFGSQRDVEFAAKVVEVRHMTRHFPGLRFGRSFAEAHVRVIADALDYFREYQAARDVRDTLNAQYRSRRPASPRRSGARHPAAPPRFSSSSPSRTSHASSWVPSGVQIFVAGGAAVVALIVVYAWLNWPHVVDDSAPSAPVVIFPTSFPAPDNVADSLVVGVEIVPGIHALDCEPGGEIVVVGRQGSSDVRTGGSVFLDLGDEVTLSHCALVDRLFVGKDMAPGSYDVDCQPGGVVATESAGGHPVTVTGGVISVHEGTAVMAANCRVEIIAEAVPTLWRTLNPAWDPVVQDASVGSKGQLVGCYLDATMSASSFYLVAMNDWDPGRHLRIPSLVQVSTGGEGEVFLEQGLCYQAVVTKHVDDLNEYVCMDQDAVGPNQRPCAHYLEDEVVPAFVLVADALGGPSGFRQSLTPHNITYQ